MAQRKRPRRNGAHRLSSGKKKSAQIYAYDTYIVCGQPLTFLYLEYHPLVSVWSWYHWHARIFVTITWWSHSCRLVNESPLNPFSSLLNVILMEYKNTAWHKFIVYHHKTALWLCPHEATSNQPNSTVLVVLPKLSVSGHVLLHLFWSIFTGMWVSWRINDIDKYHIVPNKHTGCRGRKRAFKFHWNSHPEC